MKMPEETVMSALNAGNNLQSDLESEVNGVQEQAEYLEAEARDAEREANTRAKQQDIAEEMAGLYNVLSAAGLLVVEAKECLTAAPAKSALRTQLRSVVESATEIVETMMESIKQVLIAGHAEPDPKSGK